MKGTGKTYAGLSCLLGCDNVSLGFYRASHSGQCESSTKLLWTPKVSHAILKGSFLKKHKTRKITPFTQ